jgi:hypothetical protein
MGAQVEVVLVGEGYQDFGDDFPVGAERHRHIGHSPDQG